MKPFRVLFVCTGNTCRSPMAQAIATGLASRHTTGGRGGTSDRSFEFISAGLAAHAGDDISIEAERAVEELGCDVKHLPASSRPVTNEIIQGVDRVYGLTRAHVAGLKARFPQAHVALLDPKGQDVPDPIGGPQRLYDETARRLRELILARLPEWNA